MSEKIPNRQIERISKLKDQGTECDLVNASAEEQFAAVWEMTKAAWEFKGEPVGEQGLQRHVESSRKLRG